MKNGKMLYFGCVDVNDSNYEYFDEYANQQLYFRDVMADYLQNYAMLRSEPTEFMRKLQDEHEKDPRKMQQVLGSFNGAIRGGFQDVLVGNASEYVDKFLWISTEKIENGFTVEKVKRNQRWIRVIRVVDKHYPNVLMAMLSGRATMPPGNAREPDHEYLRSIELGVHPPLIDDDKTYWNRGIHRLPTKIMSSSYPNISLVFHAFSAKAKRNMDHLILHPMSKMSNITRSIGKENYETGWTWYEYVPYSIALWEDESFLINAATLRKFFDEKHLAQKSVKSATRNKSRLNRSKQKRLNRSKQKRLKHVLRQSCSKCKKR